MSTITIPAGGFDRTLDQRMSALAKANDHRSRRAAFKRDLKAGRVSVLDVLIDPPEWAATMKVFDLLVAAPGRGRVKANKALTRARISPGKTLGGLSGRQRTELAGWLR